MKYVRGRHPAGIRLIREQRGETRAEFADRIGVTRASAGNWVRGDTDPRYAPQEALINAIPEDISVEEVSNANSGLDDEACAHNTEKRLFASDRLQEPHFRRMAYFHRIAWKLSALRWQNRVIYCNLLLPSRNRTQSSESSVIFPYSGSVATPDFRTRCAISIR